MTKKHLSLLILVLAGRLFCAGQVSPDEIPGLVMWLKADQGITTDTDGKVSNWTDASGQGHDAYQNFGYLRPTLLPESLNGLPTLSFDGEDDHMVFPEVTNIRTVFWVIRESPAAPGDWPRRSLLGHNVTMYFLRGTAKALWDPFASPFVVNGVSRINFEVVNGLQDTVPSTFSIISLQTTGGVSANHLTMDINVYSRNWWGEIAEIIIYDQPLSETQTEQIETYLADKFSPSFDGIADVEVPYGFCDTTICAPSGYLSYLWSDGSNAPCFTADGPGEYSLQLTDSFGRIQTDTFTVSYPGSFPSSLTTICSGEEFVWDLLLNPNDYSITWPDGSNESDWSTPGAGTYTLSVTDSLDCTASATWEVTVDPFPTLDLLAPDYTLCSGNSISLPAAVSPEDDITWSNGENALSVIPLETGNLSVTVTNATGCVADDETNITIAGDAPEVDIQIGTACENTEIAFEAVSPESIVSWMWDFGSGATEGAANMTASWAEPGNYPVTVTVTSQNGCPGTANTEVVVHENPVPVISYSSLCEDQNIQFIDETAGDITSWTWTINGTSFTTQEIMMTFADPGSQSVNLQVTDTQGCVGETTIPLYIQPLPLITASAEGLCQGVITTFDAEIDPNGSGTISSVNWSFGDGSFSGLTDPVHFYPEPGSYDLALEVTAQNGCQALWEGEITITPPPQLDFVTGNACIGQPYFLEASVSLAPGDYILSYNWTLNEQVIGTAEATSFVPVTEGFNNVGLAITTAAGCSATIHQQIPAWPAPVAAFSSLPVAGQPPYSMQFFDASEGTNLLFEWTFGSLGYSSDESPVFQFPEQGEVDVILEVFNLYGCSDAELQTVRVVPPLIDLEVLEAHLVPMNDGRSQIHAVIRNSGTLPVHSFDLDWQAGGELVLTEEWSGLLLPGEIIQYEFSSSFIPEEVALDYYCVRAWTEELLPESTPDNNTNCQTIDGNALQLYPPFPNPGDDQMFIRFVTPVESDLNILLSTTRGQLVRNYIDSRVSSGFHQYFIDIRDLADGEYVVTLIMGSQRRSATFIKASQ